MRPQHGRAQWLFPVGLVILCLVVFSGVWLGESTYWDDYGNLVEEPHLNPPSFAGLLHFWESPVRGLYIPLTYSVWGLAARIAFDGSSPAPAVPFSAAPFHAVNLLIHVLSVLVVYAISLEIFRAKTPAKRPRARKMNVAAIQARSAAAAAAGAALLAVHPVQVEPVAWISGLKDLLL